MRTPQEKGDALEIAVAAIEHHILSTSPSLREKTFLIESKKIIQVGGVHHEIDVFVRIDLGGGYTSTFIFECKNWEAAVGKNEIIVFAEKIAAAQAQHGFFVAKSFTKDGEAQAALNPRVRLVIASEHHPAGGILPDGFHTMIQIPLHVETAFHKGDGNTELKTIDIPKAVAALRGEAINLGDYLVQWADEAANADSLKFQSGGCPAGDYERSTSVRRDYAKGEFIVDGMEIAWAEQLVRYNARIVRPAVISHFEVRTRGRVVSLAPVHLPVGGAMEMKLIYH